MIKKAPSQILKFLNQLYLGGNWATQRDFLRADIE